MKYIARLLYLALLIPKRSVIYEYVYSHKMLVPRFQLQTIIVLPFLKTQCPRRKMFIYTKNIHKLCCPVKEEMQVI